jgi:hypothetical protein
MGSPAGLSLDITWVILQSAVVLCGSSSTYSCPSFRRPWTYPHRVIVLHWDEVLDDRNEDIPLHPAHQLRVFRDRRAYHESQRVRLFFGVACAQPNATPCYVVFSLGRTSPANSEMGVNVLCLLRHIRNDLSALSILSLPTAIFYPYIFIQTVRNDVVSGARLDIWLKWLSGACLDLTCTTIHTSLYLASRGTSHGECLPPPLRTTSALTVPPTAAGLYIFCPRRRIERHSVRNYHHLGDDC